MAYVFVEDFKSGLDRRKEQINGTPGSVWELINAHITRGGAIERRKKFVESHSLPSGTHGLHAIGGSLYVFGSGSTPGAIPSGVTYQRLQHPDGSTAMSKVLMSESFDGKIYAIAQYADSNIYHFYNGVSISDWTDGIVTTEMSNNDGIAEHLKLLIDANAGFGATRSGAIVTITGATNTAFDIETLATNKTGGTDNQTLSAASTQTAITSVTEILASGSFSVTGGTANTNATGGVTLSSGSSGSVNSVTVNGVTITSGAVNFNSSLTQTATDLKSNINAHTSNPNYTATSDGAVVTISAAASVGADANTFAVVSAVTTIGKTDANLSGGVTNAITSITVDGVQILSSRVNWSSSNSALAASVATQIGNFNSSPEYVSSNTSAVVNILPVSGTGVGPNGFAINITVVGNVTVSSTISLDGGVAAVSGRPQKNTVTVGGTFEVGDKFNVKLGTKNFGSVGNPDTVGKTALTFKTKIYSVLGSTLHFCGVNNPTVWDVDSETNPGAGFINMASQDEGSEELFAAAVYQGNLAVFSRRAIQIWSVSADDAANTFLQVVKNTGTRARKGVASYGNNDVFYLADSGIRSIRARDSSNAAYVSDVGTPIDPLVTDFMAGLSDTVIEDACAVLEPIDDRFWLAIGTRIFVFSYFPGSKISAWSYYDVTDDIGAAISEFARVDSKIYARSANKIYLYGGSNGVTYPSAGQITVTVELPFLTAGTPGTIKNIEGFDAALTGQWTVLIQVDPTNTAATINVGTIAKSTYPVKRAVVQTGTTHFAPKLTCTAAGAATLSNLTVHYEDPNEAG